MDQDRYEREGWLFDRALEAPEEQRDAFLAAACSGDTDLAARIRELLRLHAATDARLDVSPVESWRTAAAGPLPEHLGSYRILGLLGRGGMGVVYRAQDANGRTVALKVLRTDTFSIQGVSHLRREAEALGRLDHPGIARFFEAGAFETPLGIQPYFAMELIEGNSLRAQGHQLEFHERILLLADICDAAHHAHERGIVHRDLKPENILIGSDGRPHILDFGIAQIAGSDRRLTTLLTSTGHLVGTIQYMSPEQIQARSSGVDARSDVYSLGVVGYELLAGRLPYDVDATSIVRVLVAILTEPIVPLGDAMPALRGPLEDAFSRALEKDPAERFQSAAEMGATLRRAVESGAPRRRRSFGRSKWRRRLRRLRRSHVALGLAFVALIAISFRVWRTYSGTDAAYRQVIALVEQANFDLHRGARTREGVARAITSLSSAREILLPLESRPYKPHLLRFVHFRLGEAYYFSGAKEHDVETLGQAIGCWDYSQYFPPGDPCPPITPTPQFHVALCELDPELPFNALGGALIELSRYQDPLRNTMKSLSLRELALRALCEQLEVEWKGPLAVPARTFTYGSALQGLGDTYLALGELQDSLPAIETAMQFFVHIDTLGLLELAGTGLPGASLQHSLGMAFLQRGELTRSTTDADHALAHLRRAEAVRSVDSRTLSLTESKRAIARALLLRGRLARSMAEKESSWLLAERSLQEARTHSSPDLDVDRALSNQGIGELCCDMALGRGELAPLLRADSLLDEADEVFSRRHLPIQTAEVALQRARIERLRWTLGLDKGARDRALMQLEVAAAGVGAESFPSFHRRIQSERALLEVP